MGFSLTVDQQRVIDERNKNLLVAAAAGSGKTAVLVRRIIALILDKENPIDVDSFLIVTFTKAAAAEMKERLFSALNKELSNNPKDRHLLRQTSLVHFADICTIDSFCAKVLREHFNEAGVNPDFGIASEEDLKILMNEVLDSLIEEHFENPDPDFTYMMDTFVNREKITPVREMVFNLFSESESNPWPLEWLREIKEDFKVDSVESLMALKWYQRLYSDIRESLGEICSDYEDLINFSRNNLDELTESHPYTTFFTEERDALVDIYNLEGPELYEKLGEYKFKTITSKKLKGEDPDLRASAKAIRDSLKDRTVKLKELLINDKEWEVEKLRKMSRAVIRLIDLTMEYRSRFLEEKISRNMLSFSDVEHFALNVLRDEKTKEPTETAKGLRDGYNHVMVDEYQDSNYLQEAILTAVTRTGEDSNYFLVGDVKQSIYRFRKARPSLFTEKYKSYKGGLSNSLVIDLSKNFRSRINVTEFVNQVFSELMKEDVGGIKYDDAASLKHGALSYSEEEGRDPLYDPYMLIAFSDDPIVKEAHIDKESLEARLIAGKIRDIVGKVPVTGEDGKKRPARYSDIVILHRNGNSISPKYTKVLNSFGIPVHTAGTKGYFESIEIEGLVSMMSLLSNPYNDIALCACLKNFYGFTMEDLTMVRVIAGKLGKGSYSFFSDVFFDICDEENIEFAPDALNKMRDFRDEYTLLRSEVMRMHLYEIIERIVKINDFDIRLLSRPAGELKLINIEKLTDMAISYESKFSDGLSGFVKYLSDFKDFEIDFGSALLPAEDSVRLMTIHKSKGLEFPICFLAGCAREKRGGSGSGGMEISDSYGVAFNYIDREKSKKESTGHKNALKYFDSLDESAEVQRLLYVALTRAKEMLILTAVGKEKTLRPMLDSVDNKLNGGLRRKSSYFVHWLIPILKKHGYVIREVPGSELVKDAVEKEVEKKLTFDITKFSGSSVDEKDYKDFKDGIKYQYPITAALSIKSKYSVSDLKMRHLEILDEEDEGEENPVYENPDEDHSKEKRRIPKFMEGYVEEKNPGAKRGTAYHRFMECVRFFGDIEISGEIERMVAGGLLLEEDAALLDKNSLAGFFKSDICQRMKEAFKREELFREKTFVMGRPSCEVFPDLDFSPEERSDTTLIQGIVDCFFIEDGKIVLLDYKTDKGLNEIELCNRYKSQLELYGDALLRAYGMEVSSMYLYSFSLDKEILVC